MHAPARITQLGPGLNNLHLPTLADHQVEIEALAEVFPQAQVLVLKTDAGLAQVIRADDGGVAAGVAAAQPATLKNGHPPQSLIAHQVPGSGQAMTATTDHHCVVTGCWLSQTPGTRPAAMTEKSLPQKL